MAQFNITRGLYDNLPDATAATEGTLYVTTDTSEMYAFIDGQMLALSGTSGRASVSYNKTLYATDWETVLDTSVTPNTTSYKYVLNLPQLTCGTSSKVPPLISCESNYAEFGYISDADFEPRVGITFHAITKPAQNIDVIIIDSAYGKLENKGGSAISTNYYAYCVDPASQNNKTVYLANAKDSDGNPLYDFEGSAFPIGTVINVVFAQGNSVSDIYMSVQGTNEAPVHQYDGKSPVTYSWHSGAVVPFVYTGVSWMLLSREVADASTAGIVKVSDSADSTKTAASGYTVSPAALATVNTTATTAQTTANTAREEAEAARTVWSDFE